MSICWAQRVLFQWCPLSCARHSDGFSLFCFPEILGEGLWRLENVRGSEVVSTHIDQIARRRIVENPAFVTKQTLQEINRAVEHVASEFVSSAIDLVVTMRAVVN